MWLRNTYYNFRYSANMLNIRTQCQWSWGSMGSWSTGGPGGLRGPETGSYFSTMPLKTISSSLWIAFLLMFGKLTLWCLVFTKGLTYNTKKIQVQETVQRFFSVANFIGKRLCRSLFLHVCKFIKKRLQPVEFVTFFTEHLWWLLLKIVEEKVFSVICSTLAACV